MIKKGDVVEILEAFRDPGDESLVWVALRDEEKGRVDIAPAEHPMTIRPTYTVSTSQIRLVRAATSTLTDNRPAPNAP